MRNKARQAEVHGDALKKAEAFIDKVVAPRHALSSVDPKALRAQRDFTSKTAELARNELKAANLDPKRLDALAQERSEARSKLAEDARRRTVQASAAAAKRLKSLVPVILPLEPMQTVIDTVTFIRTFADQGSILESNTGPGDNWARYRVKSTSDAWDGTGRLSFFTLWRNQLTVPAIVAAQANLVINANLSCDADWAGVASWFGMSSTAGGKVRLRTTVWGMDSSVSSIVQQQDLAAVGVDGGFFGDDSSQSIEFNELLPATGVVVLADAYILIEVEVLIDWHASGDASATLDAESGAHRIDLPQLVLTVTPTQAPPSTISLSASVDNTTSPPTVRLTWSGVTSNTVDIYRNGAFFVSAPNTGSRSTPTNPGTYVFHVCEAGSSTVCSTDVTVTVA